MKQLLHKLKKDLNLKHNTFLKLYVISIFLLNLIYVFLETYKLKTGETFVLDGNLDKLEFTQLLNIANINTTIEWIIICLVLSFLILIRIKNPYINIKQFLIINIIFYVLAGIISYIISIIFSVVIGNLIQQLIAIAFITNILLVYYIVKTLYKKLSQLI